MSLKVLSYNIHKGFSMANRQMVLAQIRDAIRAIEPDFVFLQEVVGHPKEPDRFPDELMMAQFEFLADEIWHHYAYGKNAVYADAHHGNAILSKYPIAAWENIDISTNNLEKRGILHAVAEIPALRIPVHLMCLHLDLREAGRVAQAAKLAERIASSVGKEEVALICGDFNDWRQSIGKILTSELEFDEAFMKLHGAYPKTFPSVLPLLRLDRIYFRNLLPLSASRLSGGVWARLSDHLAVQAEFKLRL